MSKLNEMKKIEQKVVDAYNKIEDTVVGTYK